MATESALKLTEQERQSPLWKKIVAHQEARLALLRVKNDSDKDDEPTAKLRGRIAEVKNLLALDKPAPVIEAEHAE